MGTRRFVLGPAVFIAAVVAVGSCAPESLKPPVAAGEEFQVLEDGSMMIDLRGRYQSVSVAKFSNEAPGVRIECYNSGPRDVKDLKIEDLVRHH